MHLARVNIVHCPQQSNNIRCSVWGSKKWDTWVCSVLPRMGLFRRKVARVWVKSFGYQSNWLFFIIIIIIIIIIIFFFFFIFMFIKTSVFVSVQLSLSTTIPDQPVWSPWHPRLSNLEAALMITPEAAPQAGKGLSPSPSGDGNFLAAKGKEKWIVPNEKVATTSSLTSNISISQIYTSSPYWPWFCSHLFGVPLARAHVFDLR